MRPKYTNVAHARRTWAREPAAGQSPAPAPHVFLRMKWSFVAFSPMALVGRARSASEILRLNLLDVELRYTLAHCLQNIFERRGVALDPSQRVDACHHKRSQVRTHQSAFLQFLDYRGYLFFEVQHDRGPLLVMLKGRAQWLVTEFLKAPKDRMVSAATEARDSFVAHTRVTSAA